MSAAVTKALLSKCEEVSEVLKSLAHPVRLKVLCQVLDGEKTVGELTEFCEISQPAMSNFLNRMKADGVVSSRKEKTSVYYRIADPKLLKLLKAIKETYC